MSHDADHSTATILAAARRAAMNAAAAGDLLKASRLSAAADELQGLPMSRCLNCGARVVGRFCADCVEEML